MIEEVKNGRVNQCYIGKYFDKKIFVKRSTNKNQIELELKWLHVISKIVNTPKILCFDSQSLEDPSAPFSKGPKEGGTVFLEYIDPVEKTCEAYKLFGESLCNFHNSNIQTNVCDFYMGKIHVNANDNWCKMFYEILLTINENINKDKISVHGYVIANAMCEIWNEFCKNKVFDNVLLHGDMNDGNWIFSDNKVWYIDPMCMYGDRMYDITAFLSFAENMNCQYFLGGYGLIDFVDDKFNLNDFYAKYPETYAYSYSVKISAWLLTGKHFE